MATRYKKIHKNLHEPVRTLICRGLILTRRGCQSILRQHHDGGGRRESESATDQTSRVNVLLAGHHSTANVVSLKRHGAHYDEFDFSQPRHQAHVRA